MQMKKLDLHHKRHSDVERLTENFVFGNDLPLEIVTGNSEKMRSLVQNVLDSYKFKYYSKWHTNFGSTVVIDYLGIEY